MHRTKVQLLFFSSFLILSLSIFYEYSYFVELSCLVGIFIAFFYSENLQKTIAESFKSETMPYEKQLVAKILEKHGTNTLDFFKLWEDKSYYFSSSLNSFLAYRNSGNDAIVLGDPVGPKEELNEIVMGFEQYCLDAKLSPSFFQASQALLVRYEELGYRKLKIGDEAIVDIENFSLEGANKKDFRNRIRKMEKLGYTVKYYDQPLSDEMVIRLKQISQEWLSDSKRKERGFSLGYFSDSYIKQTAVMTVEDEDGTIIAFLNIIPSYKKSELGIDLMRKSRNAPSGVMDYLFVKTILYLKTKSYTSLNIGMAPMAGFQTHEKAAFEELAVHSIFQRLNFLFNYIGLKVFKEKFADSWEPKYLIYKKVKELPKLAISIKNVLEKV
jgi:phosphatidylglycerol lysyltransferase